VSTLTKEAACEAVETVRAAKLRFSQWETVEAVFIAVEAKEKLGRTTLRLLAFLMEEAMNPVSLAERLKISTAAVTGQIDKAEKRGWVKREHSKEDRRFVQVSLTPEGARKIVGIFSGKEAA
jgi:DNA-binding MarR family transcriptional regulator